MTPLIQKRVRNTKIPTKLIDYIRLVGSDGYDMAAKVQSPTLILQGTEDEIVQSKFTRQFITTISSYGTIR